MSEKTTKELLFTYESCQDGYVIYYKNKKVDGWQVSQILNDFFGAKQSIIEAIYVMHDSEKQNIHNFMVKRK